MFNLFYLINQKPVPTKYCSEFIALYEGCPTKKINGQTRAVPYLDPVGIPTIGYGRVISWDQYRALKNTGISMAQAKDNLAEDIRIRADKMLKYIKVPVHDYQFDALVSFTFNVGVGAFSGSTLLKKLNRKDYAGAANEFGKWVWSKKKKLPGLVRRREAEKNMFLNKPPRTSSPNAYVMNFIDLDSLD